ncbi:MAG TPA: hypothetical protein VJJ25_01785 [Nitrosopumilaceae archaeon]|nr:hypothetical protein [Nitrosopumilaceae archaeon]
MVTKIIFFLVIAFGLFVIVDTFFRQGTMTSTVQNIKSSIEMIAYTDELDEISKVVDEFLVLRTIRGTEDGKELATKIDERINNLDLVKMYCSQRISTLELAYEIDPYQKLQQMCPSLKNIPFSKAVELFRLI